MRVTEDEQYTLQRLSIARSEMAAACEYDSVIVNEIVDDAAGE